jgi:hypothetical protein
MVGFGYIINLVQESRESSCESSQLTLRFVVMTAYGQNEKPPIELNAITKRRYQQLFAETSPKLCVERTKLR